MKWKRRNDWGLVEGNGEKRIDVKDKVRGQERKGKVREGG